MADKIRPQTVAEAVIERILSDISSGQLKAEQKLPTQRDMARHLGVSISSVREALQSLQTMGVIEIHHGVGAFVLGQAHVRPMHKPDAWSLSPTSRRIEEVMEARCVVEIGLACLAAERATQEHIQELNHCFAEMTRALSQNDGRLYSKHDVRFHMLLAESSGNVLLSQFTHSLDTLLQSLIESLPYSSAGLLRHRPVLDAVRNRNPSAAASAMAGLMSHTVSLLREHAGLTGLPCTSLDIFLAAAEGGKRSTPVAERSAHQDVDTG